WISSTQFEEKMANTIGAVGSAFEMMKDILHDEDGESAKNWKRTGDEHSLADLTLEETILATDVEASAIGAWSAEKGGLVPQDSPIVKPEVTVVPGPLERMTSQDGLPESAGTYLVSATIMILVGAGILAVALFVVPQMH